MESISMAEELSLYNLEGKWNDYIGVQKEVLRVLREKKFFDECEVMNIESGILVRITSKGVRETLGNGNRFQILPKRLKQLKIVTVRYLPYLLRTGYVISINVENSHDKSGYSYAYIGNTILVDNKVIGIRIAIKKKVGSNHFWIHNIDEK